MQRDQPEMGAGTGSQNIRYPEGHELRQACKMDEWRRGYKIELHRDKAKEQACLLVQGRRGRLMGAGTLEQAGQEKAVLKTSSEPNEN